MSLLPYPSYHIAPKTVLLLLNVNDNKRPAFFLHTRTTSKNEYIYLFLTLLFLTSCCPLKRNLPTYGLS
ncbi:hypothetical protein CW304_08810 [Bacillus sp. UFRGS-B20]|nr:hypothetical protein CW304_08810 [Bacillus sp. UFRGS-B20]